MPTPISPLRQRMIDDMRLRNLADTTQRVYIRSVANYARYHGRSPDTLGYDDVREYHLHLVSRGLKATSIRQILTAIRFFYTVTLSRKDTAEEIPLPRTDDPMPSVLSPDEIARFLAQAPSTKERALFATIYGAGLRVSEATALTVSDINSAGMTILIRMSKQRRDRHVMLSPELLPILRAHWREARPQHWLFPGCVDGQPMTTRAVQRAFRRIADVAGLDLNATVHTLRHSFATHLLEQGVDIRVIQGLMGHRCIASTTRYARVDLTSIRRVASPLGKLDLGAGPPG